MWSTKTQAEQHLMLTAKFFDSEGEDFLAFLEDWFVVTLEFSRDAAKAFAKDIVAIYEVILADYLENLSTL